MRLQRSFPSREGFARTFVRRLSETEMEVVLPRQQVLPAGTVIDLDLRLEDGSPLLVGRGEVGPAGGDDAGGARRIRFLELDDGSRAELRGLVALATSRAGPKPNERDPDETLEALVAGVFGKRTRRLDPDDTVLVPPEPRATPQPTPPVLRPDRPERAPQPSVTPTTAPSLSPVTPPPVTPEPAPPPVAVPAREPSSATPRENDEPPRRPSLLRRLQVSPAVIVASIIAGATGAAADAWFDDLAAFFSELTADDVDYAAPPTVDLLPVGLSPSRFSEAEEPPRPTPAPAETASAAAAGPGASLPRPAETAPAAEVAEPEAAAEAPADRVRVITWDESADGTVVTFWGNGAFLPERVVRFRIAGARPRELVKLRGIDLPFPDTVLEAGTPEVTRIRTGFHPQERVNELHVVLDLPGSDVAIDRVETGPQSLRVHLSRGGALPPS